MINIIMSFRNNTHITVLNESFKKKVKLGKKKSIIEVSDSWNDDELTHIILWANDGFIKNDLHHFDLKDTKNIKLKQIHERQWGNRMARTFNNQNWTTKVGEGLVYRILKKICENTKYTVNNINTGKLRPDFEVSNLCYVEVKTFAWTSTGTANEKIVTAPIKYSELLNKKPLLIVLIAKQAIDKWGKLLIDNDIDFKSDGFSFINDFKKLFIKHGVKYISIKTLCNIKNIIEFKNNLNYKSKYL